MPKKVTVIGAGNVGATCAQRIVEHNVADVVLIDVIEGLAEGKALDIMQSAPILGFESVIEGTHDFDRSRESDVIIMTAGLARKPGMSRDDLAQKNARIMKEVMLEVAPLSPNAILIIVTNPLDAMCYIAQKYSGFPYTRVIGMAGELDGARLSYFVREKQSCNVNELYAVVLGTHGDAMVPVPRLSKAGEKNVDALFSEQELHEIIEKTKKGGAQIVGLLKTGSAYYAPSAAAFAMACSVLQNEQNIFCCSVYLQGEYGIQGTYCGVPVRLGEQGVEEIIDIELTAEEQQLLQASAQTIKENTDKVRDI